MRLKIDDRKGREMDAVAEAEFEAYVSARSDGLMRLAYLLCGNRADAEDLLQTALAKTYLAYPRIRDKHALDAYVRRTLATTQTSIWRRRASRREVIVAEVPTAAPGDAPRFGQPDTSDTVDLRDALWRALGQLGKRQRAVVILRYYEDLSETETAAALGISAGTVKSQAARALASLRRESGLIPPRPTTQEVSS
jgi:RNA polymerase sigma-70 factor (sigma-E family)